MADHVIIRPGAIAQDAARMLVRKVGRVMPMGRSNRIVGHLQTNRIGRHGLLPDGGAIPGVPDAGGVACRGGGLAGTALAEGSRGSCEGDRRAPVDPLHRLPATARNQKV